MGIERFKVWDTKNKCWVEDILEAYNGKLAEVICNRNGCLSIRKLDENGNEYLDNKGAENLKKVNCTGLRDKNGKLIFEGDIVKGYFNIKYVENSTWLDLTDEEKKQGFKIYVVDNIHFGYEYPIPNDLEIIGNIYENPDLLGG